MRLEVALVFDGSWPSWTLDLWCEQRSQHGQYCVAVRRAGLFVLGKSEYAPCRAQQVLRGPGPLCV